METQRSSNLCYHYSQQNLKKGFLLNNMNPDIKTELEELHTMIHDMQDCL